MKFKGLTSKQLDQALAKVEQEQERKELEVFINNFIGGDNLKYTFYSFNN